jgi:hypothetical protein
VVALGAFAGSCRAATEITLVVSTDVPCSGLRGTSVTVGRLGDIETKSATTSSTFCDASGNLGTLVVVPSGAKGDEVALKVVAGLSRDADACVPPYGKGCIVARRAVRFLPHTPLRIGVPLRAACDGVACGADETCVTGGCVSATISDPSACTGTDGCGEAALGNVPPEDAGVDAPAEGPSDGGVVPTYNDMTNPAFWSSFDLTQVSTTSDFVGAVFDGRSVLFVPGSPSILTRYDTQAPFGATSSWTTFTTRTLGLRAGNFAGAAFDGRYMYMAPVNYTCGGSGCTNDGLITRYDTRAPLTDPASYATLDPAATVNPFSAGFFGAVFDGKYVYLVPSDNGFEYGVVTRYDTTAPFGDAASWATFRTTTIGPSEQAFQGGTFDGRYVYFAPYLGPGPSGFGGVVVRYDTQAPFGDAASWSAFDVSTVNARGAGFQGALFDGRYVYLVPYYDGAEDGVLCRYDTSAPFAAAASWEAFDVTTVHPLAKAFAGAAFDGRFVYLVPNAHGVVARFDTTGSLSSPASWSTFSVAPDAGSYVFIGAAFDGRYVYLAPGGAQPVFRFDAKTPSSLPATYKGSFL